MYLVFSETVVQLQRQIHRIETFSRGEGLEINIDKSKIVAFRNGGLLKKFEKWLYERKEIEIVSSYKYLGVYGLKLIICYHCKLERQCFTF